MRIVLLLPRFVITTVLYYCIIIVVQQHQQHESLQRVVPVVVEATFLFQHYLQSSFHHRYTYKSYTNTIQQRQQQHHQHQHQRQLFLISNDNNEYNDNNNHNSTQQESFVVSLVQRHDNRRRTLLKNAIVNIPSMGAVYLGIGRLPVADADADAVSDTEYLVPNPPYDKELVWPLGKVAFSLLPLAGTYTRRATIEEEIVPNKIYTHDQIQGIVNVNVPVRQTVIVLQNNNNNHNNENGGGLWVHNPVAPTPQLIKMMDRLITKHGPVKHIVLGTVALEHKATFGPFASYYPNATVWIQPGQWSFPIDIPIEFYGIVQRGQRLREIPIPIPTPILPGDDHDTDRRDRTYKPVTNKQYIFYSKQNPIPEWINEIDYEMLGPFQFQSVGGYSESVFFHKDTDTLLVTDCVVSVTKEPPLIIQEDPRALLYHSRDNVSSIILEDTIDVRQKGWRRMVQFGLIFFPSQITVNTVPEAFMNLNTVPSNLSNIGLDAIPGGTLYPWNWNNTNNNNNDNADLLNFNTISQNGTLFCPPILTKLILDREPNATLEFVNRVTTRFSTMKRIVPCHLNNNILLQNGSIDFYNAFDPLRSSSSTTTATQRPLPEDLALLQKASDLLTKYGIVAPSQVCDGEPARQVGRFATFQ